MSASSVRVRRREQREQTRREIMAAAERLLREGPYRELSVDLVMSQTGLTRTAFYRHFNDIPDLVLRLLEDVGRELYAVSERWRGAAIENPGGTAHENLAGIVDFFVEHGQLVRAVADAAATDEQIERGYRAMQQMFTEIAKQGLDELVAGGQLEVPDTQAMAQALNLMNEHFLLEQFGRQPFGDRDLALATLETVWLRAVGP